MRQRLPLFVLGLFAAINLVRGGIHSFSPDGGAGSIAGLDLSADAATIIALFATIGLMQISLGGFQLWVVMARRDLVLPVLALQTVQTLLGTIHLWLWRPLPVVVPGAGFNLALLALLGVTWASIVFRGRLSP